MLNFSFLFPFNEMGIEAEALEKRTFYTNNVIFFLEKNKKPKLVCIVVFSDIQW